MSKSLVFQVGPGQTVDVYRLPPFRWWQLVSGAQNGEPLQVTLKQGTVVVQLPDVNAGSPTPINVGFDQENTVLTLSTTQGGNHTIFPVILNLIS
jgi:hypothetical protein